MAKIRTSRFQRGAHGFADPIPQPGFVNDQWMNGNHLRQPAPTDLASYQCVCFFCFFLVQLQTLSCNGWRCGNMATHQ